MKEERIYETTSLIQNRFLNITALEKEVTIA